MEHHHYSEEERSFLRENHDSCSGFSELTDRFNKQFGTDMKAMTIRDYCHKQLKIKGMKNSGQYKIGSKSRDLPIGTIRKSQTATYIKVGNEDTNLSGYKPPNWIPLQQYLWEKKYGPIPEGHFVIFLDGNAENFDLRNLAVINRRISVRMAQNHFYTEHTEITRAGLMCVELKEKLKGR